MDRITATLGQLFYLVCPIVHIVGFIVEIVIISLRWMNEHLIEKHLENAL